MKWFFFFFCLFGWLVLACFLFVCLFATPQKRELTIKPKGVSLENIILSQMKCEFHDCFLRCLGFSEGISIKDAIPTLVAQASDERGRWPETRRSRYPDGFQEFRFSWLVFWSHRDPDRHSQSECQRRLGYPLIDTRLHHWTDLKLYVSLEICYHEVPQMDGQGVWHSKRVNYSSGVWWRHLEVNLRPSSLA